MLVGGVAKMDFKRPAWTNPKGEKIDGPLLVVMAFQAVSRRWGGEMKPRSAALLTIILDRSIGWNKSCVKTTVDRLLLTQEHPRDEGGFPIKGATRRSTFRSLDELRDLGLIRTKRLQDGLIVEPNLALLLEPWCEKFRPPSAENFPFVGSL